MPSNKVINILLTLIAGILISACAGKSRTGDGLDGWDLTDEQRDSIAFASVHHYSVGYNFQVRQDSIALLTRLIRSLPTPSQSRKVMNS